MIGMVCVVGVIRMIGVIHCLVLLSYTGLGPGDLLNELARRAGVSGVGDYRRQRS